MLEPADKTLHTNSEDPVLVIKELCVTEAAVKKINGSTFNLQFADQETMKVEILNRIKLGPFANYAFNGADPVIPVATPYTRQLEKSGANADPNPSFFSVRLTFADSGGGSFQIRITGDAGGDVSTFDYDQAGAQAEEQVHYTINIA